MYIGGIPSLLFVLHGFVYGNLVWEEFVTLLSFFVFVIVVLVLLTITGVKLNRKMHKPAEYLLSLNIEKMPGKGSEIFEADRLTKCFHIASRDYFVLLVLSHRVKVAAFLSRLQGKSIGFHVYHLFTIDTSTIMMVCGTILTYAVVIIQFQPGIGGGGGGSIVSAPLPNPTPSPSPPTPTTLAHTLAVALNGTN
ncbi:uncharacterized protein [Littorina saxatilis]|uniref:uncharacterized protein n=1 Tax=Littorina saxatilis TaxID=31220 RepID=UPI0038B55AE3